MNALVLSFARRFGLVLGVILISVSCMMVTGCGGSEEMMEDEEGVVMMDPVQKTIDSLQAENATMMARVSKLEQDNRNLTAQVAELETRLAEAAKAPTPPPRMMGDAKIEYDHGLSLFNQRSYQEALSVFMGLLNTSPPEGLESNCHYWIGECYYGMREYGEALKHFETVFNYPRTTKRDDAQLKIALCYLMMGSRDRAREEYQKLVDEYPASPYVNRAKAQLEKLK